MVVARAALARRRGRARGCCSPPRRAATAARAGGGSGARPRFVWTITPVALSTAPQRRPSRPRARATRSASAVSPASSSARRRFSTARATASPAGRPTAARAAAAVHPFAGSRARRSSYGQLPPTERRRSRTFPPRGAPPTALKAVRGTGPGPLPRCYGSRTRSRPARRATSAADHGARDRLGARRRRRRRAARRRSSRRWPGAGATPATSGAKRAKLAGVRAVAPAAARDGVLAAQQRLDARRARAARPPRPRRPAPLVAAPASCRWPSRPKPVTSVTARGARRGAAAAAAARSARVIVATARREQSRRRPRRA